MKNRCECPYASSMFFGLNSHRPYECKRTIDLAVYIRDGKEITLCNACRLTGDVRVEDDSQSLPAA